MTAGARHGAAGGRLLVQQHLRAGKRHEGGKHQSQHGPLEQAEQAKAQPGEAVALDAGILVGTILDTGFNELPTAILDISATCHMPDVIEAPYRPAMLHEDQGEGQPVRLGGPSCLAGDVIGDYMLPVRAEPGQRVAFLDQAHYSMVKTNTFNGVQLPSIYLWDSETDALELVKEFGYETFRDRLS